MVAYILLCIFPQFPLVLYLGYLQEKLFPADIVLGTLMLIFLVRMTFYSQNLQNNASYPQAFDIFAGCSTIERFIRYQTTQFMRLCDESFNISSNT